MNWLQMPVQLWGTDEYVSMRETLSPLEVINDTAEREEVLKTYKCMWMLPGTRVKEDVSFLGPILTKLNCVNSRKTT